MQEKRCGDITLSVGSFIIRMMAYKLYIQFNCNGRFNRVYIISADSYFIVKELFIHFFHTSEDFFSAEANILFDESSPSDLHGVLPTT